MTFNNARSFKFFRLLYLKLCRINDTPQKIALGIGLGVFSAIIPGTGPLAALFLAFIFRANRASALLGSLLVNTWFSLLILLPAIKLGAGILGLNWQVIYQEWVSLLKGPNKASLFKLPILKIAFPVILGYLLIAFCLALFSYLFALAIIKIKPHR